MHHVLNDSATDFIHRFALKTKHWLSGTGHSRSKYINGNFKDNFYYIMHILPDIRQLYGAS